MEGTLHNEPEELDDELSAEEDDKEEEKKNMEDSL